MRMATIIAKVAGIISINVLSAHLWRREPTPEPTLGVKAAGYSQKAAGFGKKAAGFEQNPPPFATNSGGGSGNCRKKVGVVAYTPKENHGKIWNSLATAITL